MSQPLFLCVHSDAPAKKYYMSDIGNVMEFRPYLESPMVGYGPVVYSYGAVTYY